MTYESDEDQGAGAHIVGPAQPVAGDERWSVPPPPPAPARPGRRRATTVAAATGVLALAGLGAGLATVGGGGTAKSTALTSQSADAATIAKAVDPGLVDILNTSSYTGSEAAGTGIVLTSTGEVLTNNHVISGATSVRVRDVGNDRTYVARVVGYDRTKDVAVLQLEGASGLTVASLGNSSKVATGASVVGIGNAGGTGGTPSYAQGSVVALDQSITASDSATGASERLTGLIETDADIQPGDSGGALVNASGQVIGMDTAANSAQSGPYAAAAATNAQSYAIPINEALAIARRIESGTASSTVHIGPTGFLGVSVAPSSTYSSGGAGYYGGNGFGFGLGDGDGSNSGSSGSTTTTSGVPVVAVVSGSPAAKAGLVAGDVITAVDGHRVSSATGLTNVMTTLKVGANVTITYTDSLGTTHSASTQLIAGPSQ